MSLASTIQGAAVRAMKAYGAKSTLTHAVSGAYDPATGTATNPSTVTPCFALLNSSSLKTLGFKFGEGLVQGGDMKATVSGVVPEEGDVLTILSGPYAGPYVVIQPSPVFVGSASVMHECLVRK